MSIIIIYIIISISIIITPFFYAQLLFNRDAKRYKKRKKSLWWVIKTTFTLNDNNIDFD